MHTCGDSPLTELCTCNIIKLHDNDPPSCAASFITGIALEGAYHTENQDILRGIIFFIIAVVVLLPSGEMTYTL